MALWATERDESRVECGVLLSMAWAAKADVALDQLKPSGSMAWDTPKDE